MTASWDDVASSDAYQNADTKTREATRDLYFNEVVAPHVQPSQMQQVRQMFDQETKPRSAIGEIGTALKRGTLGDLPQMVGQAVEYTSEPGNTVYEVGKKVADYGESQLNRPDMQLQPKEHGPVTNFVASGAEIIPQSVAPMAAVAGAIALAPVELPALATTALASLGGGALFGASQGQQTLEKAQRAGLPPDQAREAARITALEEGLGETVGNLVLGWSFGALEKAGTQAAVKSAGMTSAQVVFNAFKNPAWVQDFLKKLPADFAAEIGTEMAQNYSEAATEKAYGIDNQDPWEAAKQAIAPTAAMTTLLMPLGLIGHQRAAQQSRAITSAIENPDADPRLRTVAANTVYESLKTADPAAAAAWGQNAQEAIQARQPIALDESFAVPHTDADVGASVAAANTVDSAIDAANRAAATKTPPALPAPSMVVTPAGEAATLAQYEERANRREELGITPDIERTIAARQSPLVEPPAPEPRRALPAPRVVVDANGNAEFEAKRQQILERRRRELGITPDIDRAIEARRSPLVPPAQEQESQKPGEFLRFLARHGGLSREDAAAQGIDPAHFGDSTSRQVFGKPLFPKTGGMTFDEAAELASQFGYGSENYSANEMLDLVDRALRGQEVYSRDDKYNEFDARMQAERERYFDLQEQAPEVAVYPTPAELSLSGFARADEKTKDLAALFALGRERIGSDAFDNLLESVASRHENVSDAQFEAIIRREIENRGNAKAEVQATAPGGRGGENIAAPGAVVAAAPGEAPAAEEVSRGQGTAVSSAGLRSDSGVFQRPQESRSAASTVVSGPDTADGRGTDQTVRLAADAAKAKAEEVANEANQEGEAQAKEGALERPRMGGAEHGVHPETRGVGEATSPAVTERHSEAAGPIPATATPPQGGVSVSADRRHDTGRRKRVAEMSHEELKRELLTDALTGLPNRRAYDEADKKHVQVAVDVDSLKFVNDNLGHDAGDKMLQAIGQALREQGVEAYHLSGDEFMVQGDDQAAIERGLTAVAQRLERAELVAEAPDGTKVSKTGVHFSYGIGATRDEADKALNRSKAEREAQGLRAARGETPPGVKRIAPGEQAQGNSSAPPQQDTQVKGKVSSVTPTRGPGDNDITQPTPPEPEGEEFKRWFSGSKIVDAEGEPLVLYHGTSMTFDEFDVNRFGTGGWSNRAFGKENSSRVGAAFYLSSSKGHAEQYGTPLSFFASIKNPLEFDASKALHEYMADTGDKGRPVNDWIDSFGNTYKALNADELFNDLVAEAKNNGHDGVIVNFGSWPITGRAGAPKVGKVVIAFSPDQLRRTVRPNPSGAPERAPPKTTGSPSPQAPSEEGVSASAIEEAAREAATSPANNLPEPTDAQKDAGNYKLGHVSINGLDISIENPAGSRRRPEWKALEHHYGYIRGTVGKDKDHVDVFLGPHAEDKNLPVFVVDQVKKDGSFDEHKVMLGFPDESAARAGYLANYEDGWTGLGAIKRFTWPAFKLWLKTSATKRPVALKNESAGNVATNIKPNPSDTNDKGTVREPDTAYTSIDEVLKDATPEQKQLARDALADIGRPNDRRAKGTLLGSRIPVEFTEQGRISLIGQKAETPEDLAVLAQVYRDPRFETFRFFFLKGNTVVGQTGVSSRLPGSTKTFVGRIASDAQRFDTELKASMQKLGADGFYILHNHPSGNPAASTADLAVTKKIIKDFADFKFKGHVIINENKYGLISGDANKIDAGVILRPLPSAYSLAHGTPVKPHPILGETIESPQQLARVAKSVQIGNGYIVLIGTSQDGVRGIMEVPIETLGNKLRALSVVRKFARTTGSKSVFAAGVPDNKIELGRQAIRYQVLTDVIYQSGRNGAMDDIVDSRYELGARAKGTPVEEERSAYGLPQFQRSARDWLFDRLKTAKKVGLWSRTVGTMYNLAQRVPQFKPVFDAGQEFLSDVSRIAIEAEDLAPDLFRKMGSVQEVLKTGRAKEKDIAAIAEPIYRGTVVDERVYSDAELREHFGLNDEQVRLYRQAIDATHKSLDDVAMATVHRMLRAIRVPEGVLDSARADAKSMADFLEKVYAGVLKPVREQHGRNVADLKQKAERSTDDKTRAMYERAIEDATAQKDAFDAEVEDLYKLRARVNTLKTEGYFPLMRFGKYSVDVTELNPETDSHDRVAFLTFESEAEANAAARALQEEMPEATVKQGVMSQEDWRLFPGLTPDVIEAFAKQVGVDQSALFQQYLKIAVGNRSAMKRLIHRKKVPGFNKDVNRTLATFILANARLASANYHMPDMRSAIEAIPKDMGDVKDQGVKLIQYLTNPTEEFSTTRGFLFFNFIGGSIASALTNLTQVPLVTFPYLTRYGAAAASRAVMKWMKPGAKPIDEKHAADLKRAEEEGIVSPQEVYNLMATARGGALGPSKFLSKRHVQTALYAWGFLFSAAEQFNRRATFNAAYDLARQKGEEDPYAAAVKAVEETQFVYNRGNRPNWARGIGAPIFTFKQFSISYLELLGRLPAKQKAIAIALLVLAAGLRGLPFEEDLEDLLDTIMQWSGYNWQTRREMQRWAENTIGKATSDFLLSGVSGTGIPLDLQARLSFGNLIPGTSLLKPSATDKGREVAEVFGASASVARSIGSGLESLAKGETSDALRALAPKAARDFWQGLDMFFSGQYRDSQQRLVGNVTPGEAAVKAIGFQPRSVAETQQRQRELMEAIALHRVVEDGIADRIARGVAFHDLDMVRQAREDQKTWNEKNPEAKIKIEPQQISRRVKQLRLSSDERTLKSTPKEMRSFAREEMRR